MVYSYAITSNVFSFFDFCGVAGAHAHERSSEGFFFFFWYPRGSSVRVRFLRARATRSTPGRPAGVSVRPPRTDRVRHVLYQVTCAHPGGGRDTDIDTSHIKSNCDAISHRGAALPAQVKTGARVPTPIKSHYKARAQYKPFANEIGIKSHSTVARAVQTAR